MRALIIVQQPEVRNRLIETLRAIGAEPAAIEDVSQALQSYETQHHELVFITWNPNDPLGQQICRGIRQRDLTHCTVIVIAADGHSSFDLQTAMNAGADDYLESLEHESLLIRLRIISQRAKNRHSSSLIEQQLRQANLRFELAVRGANEGIWDADLSENPWGPPDTKVWFSPRYKEILGFNDEEFPNVLQSWLNQLHPDDHDRIFVSVNETIEQKLPYDVEYRLRTKAGEYRWFSSRGQGVWDQHGRLLRMAGSMRDITTIKQYEAKIKDGEATWRSLVENAPDIIIVADLEGKISFVNRFTDIATESIGHTLYEYLEEPSKEIMRKALETLRQTGKPQRFEVRGLNEHGETGVWYANRLGPIWKNDQLDSVLVIATDITRRKNAEEHLQREQQMLRLLLDFQERERKLVAYDIHDGMVQYLTAGLMHLESFAALASAASNETQSEYDRGIELLREALDEGRRLISGLRPPILDERGVVAALEYLVTELRPYIPEIKFVNDTHFDRLAPTLEVAIFRIAQEALTNVRLHSGAKRAQVQLAQHDQSVRLVIQDWGRGFEPANVEQERFGLQGITQRTRLLGATAHIESAPGKGTTISVDFPLISEKSVAPGEPLTAPS